MIRGLLAKTLRETWLATLLFGIALFLVETLLTSILPQINEQVGNVWLEIPFARMMVSAMMGIEIEDQFTIQMLQAFALGHPVVLALTWAHEITYCTRMPVGEIDRGTIDVLLGLPVSRRRLFACESAAWLASGAFVISMGLAGNVLGSRAMPADDRAHLLPVVLVLVNLYCVYVAVGGVAWLCSSLGNRRGLAVVIVFGIVLASFLLNFLAQFWEPARRLAFLSVLEYYRPALVLAQGALSPRNVIVLLGVGAAAWVTAGEVLARRSICTV